MEACTQHDCAAASLAAGEDPCGTATAPDMLLVLEVEPPWERELWRSADFPPGLFDRCAEAIKGGRSLRLQCIAPDPEYSRPGRRRLMVLHRPAGPFARYDQTDYLLPPGVLPAFVDALLGSPHPDPERFARYADPEPATRNLLICTHGNVDAACARAGRPMYDLLRRQYAPQARGLRVWQVSHFGGHRFAATVLDLPEMRSWAHLEPAVLGALVHRTGSPADLHRHYRGWAGLKGAFEQVAERAVLEAIGWPWLDYAKEGRAEVAADGTAAQVHLQFRNPDGTEAGTYEAEVRLSHRVTTQMVTGKGPESAPQYQVTRLRRT